MERQLSMARLGERHGQTETAHKIYQKVLMQDPNNVEALHRLGVMAAKTQDYEVAISYLTKAEMNDPSNVELLNDLGYALFLTDDLLGAEEKLQLAIRLKPGHRAARNNLGLVLGNAGRWDECIVQFKRAVSEAEAYANLAFVQVQMGEFALAERVSTQPSILMRNSTRPRKAWYKSKRKRICLRNDSLPISTSKRQSDLLSTKRSNRSRRSSNPPPP